MVGAGCCCVEVVDLVDLVLLLTFVYSGLLLSLVLHNQALTSELSKWTLDVNHNESYELDALGQSSEGVGREGGSGGSGGSGSGSGNGGSGNRDGRSSSVVDSVDLDLLRSFDNGASFDMNDGEEDGDDEGDLLFYGRKSDKTRMVIDPPSDDSSSNSDSAIRTTRSTLKERLWSAADRESRDGGGGSG